MNFDDLDADVVYVLPVTIASSELPILDSNRTSYFVIKGAALINVVADMARNYTQLSNPGNCAGLASMSKMTVEMLVYPRSFDREGMQAGISTLLGNEANFLLRLGDSEPHDQIQHATSRGNITDPEWKLETTSGHSLLLLMTEPPVLSRYISTARRKGRPEPQITVAM